MEIIGIVFGLVSCLLIYLLKNAYKQIETQNEFIMQFKNPEVSETVKHRQFLESRQKYIHSPEVEKKRKIEEAEIKRYDDIIERGFMTADDENYYKPYLKNTGQID